ncbi:MAG TPA: adenylate/guanylate cyclase domain-containing protein [Actinomycetota bacterium]|nr:adenylate/guanylate cyclase domain-containing protein [Actinomycetota bacterium]
MDSLLDTGVRDDDGLVDVPETKYARSADGTFIAYQVVGEGPPDIVFFPGFIWHLEVQWEHPESARTLEAFARVGRLIMFDKRGTGLSDRASPLADLDTRAQDLLAVMNATASERAVLAGVYEGGALAAFVAATYPQRVQALVWWGANGRNAWAPDNPTGATEQEFAEDQADIVARWGTTAYVRSFLQHDESSYADDPGVVAWWAKMFRLGASPREAMRFDQMWWETDVRAVLPLIHVPTLVVWPGDPEHVRSTAEAIPGAELAVLPEADTAPMGETGLRFVDEVRGFIARVQGEEAEFERVLATVLFTDIVGSTELAVDLGDRAWRDLLDRHHVVVRTLLERFHGVEVDTAGDGFLARFEGPARAVRCATAIVEAVRALGLEVRAGVHAGEVELLGDKVTGIAVHTGSRVAAKAEPGEVLVSQTVKDLVAGSGLVFEHAGEYELKGIPDRWRLYRVVPAGPEARTLRSR